MLFLILKGKTMRLFDEIRKNQTEALNIIHGTDWWRDADDAVALRVLCRAHKYGIIRLLGVGINSVFDLSAASLSAFLENEGVLAPIGVDFDARREPKGCKFQQPLARFPHRVKNNGECLPAVSLYRKLLSETRGKTVITETGFPQVLSDLLKSGADEFSPLTGRALVQEKVEAIYVVGGRWDIENGDEYNFTAYEKNRAGASDLCRRCPVPLVFLGFETGFGVTTANALPDGDLLKTVLAANGKPDGVYSWDPMLVTLAIIGNAEKAGYRQIFGEADVDEKTGINHFAEKENGPHSYIVKTQSDTFYSDMINSIIS